jgi:hypothetical protein
MEPIVNKVAQSDIEVFNLEAYWDGKPVRELDIAPMLDEGLILREIPYRKAVKELDTSPFEGCHVAVHCSTDAIVPIWAYMLIAMRLEEIAISAGFGTPSQLVRDRYSAALEAVDWSRYAGRNVVIKGCGSRVVPEAAYVEAALRLQRVANKVMFGEPCSSVPLWKRATSKVQTEEGGTVVRRVASAGKLPPGF